MWEFGSNFIKMYIFDEAIKNAKNRGAMTKLNKAWFDVIPELSKMRTHLVVITQSDEYVDSIFKSQEFLSGTWLMSRLSRCGFNEFQIKYILGKSIGVSDRTYLQTLMSEVEEKYPKVYNDYLNIAPVLNASKEELEKLLKLKTEFDATKSQFGDMLVDQKKINEKQQKDNEKLEQQIKGMYEFVHKNFDPVMELLNEISDMPEAEPLLKKARDKIQADKEKTL